MTATQTEIQSMIYGIVRRANIASTTEQMILNFYQNTARTVAQKWREKMFEAFAAGVRSGIFLLGVGVGLLGGLTAALVLGRAMIEACKALAHKL